MVINNTGIILLSRTFVNECFAEFSSACAFSVLCLFLTDRTCSFQSKSRKPRIPPSMNFCFSLAETVSSFDFPLYTGIPTADFPPAASLFPPIKNRFFRSFSRFSPFRGLFSRQLHGDFICMYIIHSYAHKKTAHRAVFHIYSSKNSCQQRICRRAWAAVLPSAAIRSSGSVPENRQMTQLPSENQILQPSLRSIRWMPPAKLGNL